MICSLDSVRKKGNVGTRIFTPPKKPAPQSQSFAWGLIDPRGFRLYYRGSPAPVLLLHWPWDFEHLLLRAPGHWWQDHSLPRCQMQRLNGHQEPRPLGFLSQFSEQTCRSLGYVPRAQVLLERVNTVLQAPSMTGTHMARLAGLAHADSKDVHVGIFSSISHFFIHHIDIM